MGEMLVLLIAVENRQESYKSYIDLYLACKSNEIGKVCLEAENADLYHYIEKNYENARKLANTIEERHSTKRLSRINQIDMGQYNINKICLYFRSR